MRIVPLLPSSCAPEPWRPFPAVELVWTGTLHPDWARPDAGPQVHALHLPWRPWGPALGEAAMAALRPRLDADFLVLRAAPPEGRAETAAFMGVLEGLLEVRGMGIFMLPFIPRAKLRLVIRMGAQPERMPSPMFHPELNLPEVMIDPLNASAPERAALAMEVA